MRWLIILITLIALAACGRPLSDTEAGFTASIFNESFDAQPVRIIEGTFTGDLSSLRPTRPRVACREKIWPPPITKSVRVGTAAHVLYNTAYFHKNIYAPDYLPEMPARMSLPAAMLFAHEMTHVWQWQNRAKTNYTPFKSAAEHLPSADPYLFDLTNKTDFLSFGYEQQGGIVEEFICCAALDPSGARTQRLAQILSPHLAIDRLKKALGSADIFVPWQDVQTRGICS
jgi:hypothetical protein